LFIFSAGIICLSLGVLPFDGFEGKLPLNDYSLDLWSTWYAFSTFKHFLLSLSTLLFDVILGEIALALQVIPPISTHF